MSRLLPLLALAIACQPSGTVDNDRPQREIVPDPVEEAAPLSWEGARTRSGNIVISEDLERTFVVDPDNGALHIFRRLDGAATSVHLGGEPVRATRIGQEVFVTLRASGEVVRLHDDGATLVEKARARVGAEPFDIVPSASEGKLYVSLSMEDAVVALDAETLSPTARWRIEGEPRWMAVRGDRSGSDQLFVASARGGKVHRIDTNIDTVNTWSLAQVRRFDNPRCDARMLSSRISGEIALSPDGSKLYIPAWYADTVIEDTGGTPSAGDARGGSRQPSGFDTGGFMPDPCDSGSGSPSNSPSNEGSAYGVPTEAETPSKVSRFNAAVVEMPLNGSAQRVFHLGTTMNDMELGVRRAVRGVPAGLEVYESEGELRVAVSLETTSTIITMAPDLLTQENAGGFLTAQRAATSTAAGPSSLRMVPLDTGELRSWSWLDRRLQAWGRFAIEADPNRIERVPSVDQTAPASDLGPDTLAGRRLFFSSDLPQMAAVGSGASCSACHADGRNDGFTWQFSDFPRQTPSLAGRISDTVPVTWTGEVESVAMEAHLTSSLRMGGDGVNMEEAMQIATFIDGSRRTQVPVPTAEEQALIEQGAAIFNRPDVGCATCHSGAKGTNNSTMAMFGLERVNVPRLEGIAATAPYFHDGSAPTLRAVLERVRDGSMGDTSMLSEDEMLALETWLRFQ